MLKIRCLFRKEIDLLQEFPPEEWNFNLPLFIHFHYGFNYFYPIIAEFRGKIIGFANGILNGKIGWLGNIIVLPGYRRKGVGSELTANLVDYFCSKGCTTQLLIASHMGENIYSKMGFQSKSTYHYFKINNYYSSFQQKLSGRDIKESDHPLLKKYDSEISGEKRFNFIKRYFPGGKVYCRKDSNDVEGLFLPNFEGGLIFSQTLDCGLELMKLRLISGKRNAIIPTCNKAALKLLKDEGYQPYQVLPRMVLGKEVNWKPQYIFNRATGYSG